MKQPRYFLVFVLLLLLGAQTAFAKENGLMSFFSKKDKGPAPAAEKTVPAASAASSAETPSSDPAAGNLAALEARMANNKTMTDAEKASLAQTGLNHFPKGTDVRSAANEKRALLFEQIVNDPNMKVAEKKAALDSQLEGVPSEAKPEAAAPAAAPAEAPKAFDTTEELPAQSAQDAIEPDVREIVGEQAEAAAPVAEEVPAAKEAPVKKAVSNFAKKAAA